MRGKEKWFFIKFIDTHSWTRYYLNLLHRPVNKIGYNKTVYYILPKAVIMLLNREHQTSSSLCVMSLFNLSISVPRVYALWISLFWNQWLPQAIFAADVKMQKSGVGWCPLSPILAFTACEVAAISLLLYDSTVCRYCSALKRVANTPLIRRQLVNKKIYRPSKWLPTFFK